MACLLLTPISYVLYTATLVDVIGSLALMADDPTRSGVSVDINITYISAAHVGDQIIVEGRCGLIVLGLNSRINHMPVCIEC